MKRQMIALMAGVALIAAPLMTNIATAHKGGAGYGPRLEFAKKLNLTDAQKTQLERIKLRTQTKIRAILTPEQQTKFDAAKAAHQKRHEPMQANGGKRPEGMNKGDRQGSKGMMRSLNLTDAQKAQMKSIHEAARAEMKTVLTAEQQAQMAQMKQRFGDRAKGRR
jgi:periplasmic protein CpxP/Spy